MKYLMMFVLVLFVGCGSDSSVDVRSDLESNVSGDFVVQYNPEPIEWDGLRELINKQPGDDRYVEDDETILVTILLYKIKVHSSFSARVENSELHYYYNDEEVSKEFYDNKGGDDLRNKTKKEVEYSKKNFKEIIRIFSERNDLTQYPTLEEKMQNQEYWYVLNVFSVELRKDEIEDFINLNQGLFYLAFPTLPMGD